MLAATGTAYGRGALKTATESQTKAGEAVHLIIFARIAALMTKKELTHAEG